MKTHGDCFIELWSDPKSPPCQAESLLFTPCLSANHQGTVGSNCPPVQRDSAGAFVCHEVGATFKILQQIQF